MGYRKKEHLKWNNLLSDCCPACGETIAYDPELVAHACHACTSRRGRPFIIPNYRYREIMTSLKADLKDEKKSTTAQYIFT